MKKVFFLGMLLTIAGAARSQDRNHNENEGTNHEVIELQKNDHQDLLNDQTEFNDDQKDMDNDKLELNDDHEDMLNDQLDLNDDHEDIIKDEKDLDKEDMKDIKEEQPVIPAKL